MPARTRRVRQDDRTRERIQATMLINRLQDHVRGKLDVADAGACRRNLAAQARFSGLGFDLFPREQETPAALGALQKADIEKWWPVIKAAGIKAE
jgi:hypothetical protein